MTRREITVLIILIMILIAVNGAGFITRQRLQANSQVIIEETVKKISINNAPASELERLPGIGASLAARIVDYRVQNGGFRSLNELKKVKGIGDKLFQKIFSFIEL